jgi:UDP-N-acetylmuramoyl-tripeptide--D-alanyl-D-alanine ligase
MRFNLTLPSEAFRAAQRKVVKLAWFRNYRASYNRTCSRATFIAVTGSSAKSTAAAMIAHILAGVTTVRAQVVKNLHSAHVRALQARPPRGGYFVGEVGADGPGALAPMLRLLKPSVGVVTLVALEHKSSFGSIEAVAQEKQRLVETLPADGMAVLNYDDPRVSRMAQRTKARVVMFGHTGGDYVVSDVCCQRLGELRLSITHQGDKFELNTGLTGVHNSVAIAAAFACTHQLGIPPTAIAERLENFRPIFGRCSVHLVKNGPTFIVDTVKAPFHSLHLALDLLAGLEARRKRIVLGQISDQTDSNRTYRNAYRAARLVADQVIFVGEHSHRSKASAEDIAEGRFVRFDQVRQAASFLKESAVADEIILLKSSSKLHLERLMLDFFEPVRCWTDVCGKRSVCVRLPAAGGCGLYKFPFEQHKSAKQNRSERIPDSNALA